MLRYGNKQDLAITHICEEFGGVWEDTIEAYNEAEGKHLLRLYLITLRPSVMRKGQRTMKLIEPAAEYAQQISAYRQAFLDCGDSMDGTGGLRRMEDPEMWVEHCRLCKDPGSVPEGLVPATQYMLVREEDGKIVGMLQIRHFLNDYLAAFGGHIGYSVAPDERRKGYASLMLSTALPRCRELGLDRVLITCIKGNEGSRRTILRNGGVYENTVFEPDEKVYLERYWIDLND